MFKSLKFKIISISLLGVLALLITVFVYVMPLYRESVRDSLKHEVKAAVDLAEREISHYRDLADKHQMPVEEAKSHARETLRDMRYNKTDYFFVYDLEGVGVMHPIKPEMEGKSNIDQADPTGNHYIRTMINLVKSDGEGFVEYSYPKVKDGPPIGKVSFVKLIKGWDWFVGSGVYQDVIDQKIHDFEIRLLTVFFVVSIIVLALAMGLSLSLAKKIDVIVKSIAQSSDDVGRSIHVVSEAGKNLAESSTSAAASLEETVASLEEVTSVVNLNSGNAQQASSLSQSSRGTAEEGEHQIKALVTSMEEISTQSKKIEEIINVIDDIAFQTNLLALNAAVEAARAGEQGKGFAVVAEAVRTLAQRSASAAKDISGLIKDSVSKVEDGQKIADKSGEVLGNIVTSVKKVADLNTEIATASGEQTRGVQQISQAMNQLDSVIQSNAASTEEISANVAEIANRMRTVEQDVIELKKLVHG
ncbi:MAG TPA: methyl-accepting chemotaxis protein [Bdellovibrio sp.]|uniref:methyl-accepting chemotaxis protein n=1 Tax=Bdellovibrio sp. TaxID=28201 RepID=UPI002EFE6421